MVNKMIRHTKREYSDDYSTLDETVEKEMYNHRNSFKDRIILCNCDDDNSAFFRYFTNRFDGLGLKKVIGVHFNGIKPSKTTRELMKKLPKGQYTMDMEPIFADATSYYLEVTPESPRIDGLKQPTRHELKGNGDYRSPEGLALIDMADIVVTNPPPSHMEEFVDVMFEHKKKFILLSKLMKVSKKTIFEHLKNDEMHYGVTLRNNGSPRFILPEGMCVPKNMEKKMRAEDGVRTVPVAGMMWFTNLEYEDMWADEVLYGGKYIAERHQRLDESGYINVDNVESIPFDYGEPMAVPISYYVHYNPKQFKMLDILKSPTIDGKKIFPRIIIQRVNLQS